jgi:ribosomal protein L16/L10AE
MPPFVYKPPRPVQFKVSQGKIPPIHNPEIMIGKTLVAQGAMRVTAEQLEAAKKAIKKQIGKEREFRMNVHATFSRTERPFGVKRGQGRGGISEYVARVPAGRVLFQIPGLTPGDGVASSIRPNWSAFRTVGLAMHARCQFRDQTNQFRMDQINISTPAKEQIRYKASQLKP